jgi:hypothetical protein
MGVRACYLNLRPGHEKVGVAHFQDVTKGYNLRYLAPCFAIYNVRYETDRGISQRFLETPRQLLRNQPSKGKKKRE